VDLDAERAADADLRYIPSSNTHMNVAPEHRKTSLEAGVHGPHRDRGYLPGPGALSACNEVERVDRRMSARVV